MHLLRLLIAGAGLATLLAAPAPAQTWVGAGLDYGYAGPYGAPWGPVYYPPVVVYPVPVYPPGVYWPGYGPDVAVRWNRYFDRDAPQIQGYTLPR